MPNTNELSSFLRTESVDDKTIVTFVNAGALVEKEFKGKKSKKLEIGVKLPDGSEKTATLNFTSVGNLSEAWGSNTEKWVNKKALINKIKVMVGGEMKDTLVFEAVKETEEEITF